MKLLKTFFKTVSILLIIIVSIIVFRAYSSRNLPDLESWNTIKPSPELLLNNDYSSFEEFVEADRNYIIENFKKVDIKGLGVFNKYNSKGISYPLNKELNYNASFVLDPGENNTKGVIVLIHGLSDSPYHIYNLGQYFLKKGFYVFGLRMPGHGTLPSGLLDVKWQDWYKAVKWSMKKAEELAIKRNNAPLYMGGFSTGGSLSIHYSLKAVTDESLAMP
jgi:predicted alpha/beta-fold hydrolase